MSTVRRMSAGFAVAALFAVGGCSSDPEEVVTPEETVSVPESTTETPAASPEESASVEETPAEEPAPEEKTEIVYEWRNAGSRFDMTGLDLTLPEESVERWGDVATRQGIDAALEIFYTVSNPEINMDSGTPVVDFTYLKSLMSSEAEAGFVADLDNTEDKPGYYETPLQYEAIALAPAVALHEGSIQLASPNGMGRDMIFDSTAAFEADPLGSISSSDGLNFDYDEPRLLVTVPLQIIYTGSIGDKPQEIAEQTRRTTLYMKPVGDGWALDNWSTEITAWGAAGGIG